MPGFHDKLYLVQLEEIQLQGEEEENKTKNNNINNGLKNQKYNLNTTNKTQHKLSLPCCFWV